PTKSSPPPRSNLFPYTTLFRSRKDASVIYLTATPREKQRWQMMTKQLNYIFVPIRFHGYPLIVPKWINSSSIQKELRATKVPILDRKSTRLNSSHVSTSYAVFC